MWIVPCEGLISVSWSGHMLTQCYSLLFTLARVYWPECAPVWRDGGHQVFKEISHRLIKRVFFFFSFSFTHLQPSFTCSTRVRMMATSPQVVSLRCGHDGSSSSSSESSEEVSQESEWHKFKTQAVVALYCTAHEYPGFVSTGVLEKETPVQCPICKQR